MLKQIYTVRFKKDVAKLLKRNKEMSKLEKVISLLVKKKTLPPKYKDHKLIGNYLGRRDCHIEPDWILIYLIRGDELILERTGTHSDLFK